MIDEASTIQTSDIGLIDGEFIRPSMNDIRNVDKRYSAISTFAGCGGSSLGYRMAGFRVLWANEFVDIAAKTYRLNHSAVVNTEDIRELTADDVMREAGVVEGELDLLDGSPPCAAFSSSGTVNKGWGKIKEYSDKSQRVDDLFFDFARMVKGLKPKVFIAENVKGLVQGRAKGYFLDILGHLRSLGYNVEARLINSARLKVPQRRPRLIFMGVRQDLGRAPDFPKPFPDVVAIQDLYPYVREVKYGSKPYNWKRANRPSPTIMQSDHSRKETAYLSGGGFIKVQEGTRVVKRKWTIDELKGLFTFPEDFELIGTWEQRWERMGRSVPPFVSFHLGQSVAGILDEQ